MCMYREREREREWRITRIKKQANYIGTSVEALDRKGRKGMEKWVLNLRRSKVEFQKETCKFDAYKNSWDFRRKKPDRSSRSWACV